jgi:hypothetical protein
MYINLMPCLHPVRAPPLDRGWRGEFSRLVASEASAENGEDAEGQSGALGFLLSSAV